MEVAAYLPPPLLSHLRIVLARQPQLTVAATWGALAEIVRRQSVDVVVVDPQLDPANALVELETLVTAFPSVPVVVYTVLAPATLKTVMELAKRGVEHVVLHRFDDSPGRFLELLERLPADRLSEQVLERLAPPLAGVQLEVARAVEWAFRTPTRFRGAEELAAAAGVNRRQLYRQLEGAGLASPHTLLQAARLLRAFAYLQDPGAVAEDVATKLGYSEPRVLSRHMQATVGLRPSELRGRMTGEEFIDRLVGVLLEGGGALREPGEPAPPPARRSGRTPIKRRTRPEQG